MSLLSVAVGSSGDLGSISVTRCAEKGLHGGFVARVHVSNGVALTGQECCGNGQCDGAETGANCPEDCMPDDLTLEVTQSGSDANGWTTKVDVAFVPWRQAAGRRLLQCFEAVAAPYNTSLVSRVRTSHTGPSYCIVYEVERCSYCVPPGMTLEKLARQQFKNFDWLRLYNTNPHYPVTGVNKRLVCVAPCTPITYSYHTDKYLTASTHHFHLQAPDVVLTEVIMILLLLQHSKGSIVHRK